MVLVGRLRIGHPCAAPGAPDREGGTPRSTAQDQLPLLLLSFMSESRQMDNTRMKRELKLKLRYPSVTTGLLPPQLF